MKRIAIHSAPRSGSSWLGTLIDAHPSIIYKFQPLFSYEYKAFLNASSTKKEIDRFFYLLQNSKSKFLDRIDEKSKGIVPSFFKTKSEVVAYKEVRYHYILSNLLSKDSDFRAIGLIRDPRATIYSWWKAPREFDKGIGWNINDEWYSASKKNSNKKEEYYGFKKWKELALLFEQLQQDHPERFKIVRYHDLISNSYNELESIMRFFQIEINEQQLSFLEDSRQIGKKDPYAVYKKKKLDTDWINNLPEEISISIHNDLYGTSLEKYLDEF